MFYKLRKSLATRRFYRQTRAILDTRPMPVVPAAWSVVSMVGSDDVQMYVLGMKAFYRRLGRGRLVAIYEPHMPAKSRALLAAHFPGIELVAIESIDVSRFQHGGCWERLVYLLGRSQHEYVIQMDCDTLAYGPDIQEVLDCIAANRAFTLSGVEQEIVSLPEAARRARSIDHPYVGLAAEARFDLYPGAESLRYVRGSAGFTGFAKGGFSLAQLEVFHRQMQALLPERWSEWGTEQCACNFAISNSPDAMVLPCPKYHNFDRHQDVSKSSFLHFIGAYRFDDDRFAELGRRVIAELQSAPAHG